MTLDELVQSQRVRVGWLLPKYALIDDPRLSSYPRNFLFRQVRIERNGIHAYVNEGSGKLALTVANCTPEAPCGEVVLCYWCKVLAALDEVEAMLRMVGSRARRKSISNVTVILGVVPMDEWKRVQALLAAFRKDWSRICAKWLGSRWRGWVELDLLTGHKDEDLGIYAYKTLTELGWDPTDPQDYVAVHAHLIMCHPRYSRADVAGHLASIYPLTRQVHVKSVFKDQTVEEGVTRFTTYMRKFRPPEFALAGRGSRTCRPRHPGVIRDYIRLQHRFRGNELLIKGSMPL
jgi:hypothetical protein